MGITMRFLRLCLHFLCTSGRLEYNSLLVVLGGGGGGARGAMSEKFFSKAVDNKADGLSV
jgi:hypothetical protein